MKKRSKICRTAAVLIAALLGIPGCAPASREKSSPPPVDLSLVKDVREDPSYNKAEEFDQSFVLPPAWDERAEAPESLVGSYIAIVPDRKSQTGYRAVLLGQVLTPQGVSRLGRKDLSGEGPRYQGKAESSFASKLSFLRGRMDVRQECLYEIEVVNARTTKTATDPAVLDRKKIERTWSRLPKKYREILFVTAATEARIAVQEFERCTVFPTGTPRLLRLEDNYFQALSSPAPRRAVYLTAISDSSLFGDLDARSGLYVKKERPSKVSLKGRSKNGTIISFQSMKLLRKTLAVNGLSLPD
jgi:hypothetical protein